MNFGYRLKTLRLENNLSQVELAQKLGLSANTISQYETGKRFPDQKGIVAICRFFNISSDYLIGLSSIRQPAFNSMAATYLNEKQQTAIYDLIIAFKDSEEKK